MAWTLRIENLSFNEILSKKQYDGIDFPIAFGERSCFVKEMVSSIAESPNYIRLAMFAKLKPHSDQLMTFKYYLDSKRCCGLATKGST